MSSSSTLAPAPSSRHDASQLERRDAHRGRVINRSAALQKRREEFAANARPVSAKTSTIYDWSTSLTASPIQLRAFDGAIEDLHDAVSVGNHEVWGDPLPSHLQYRKRDKPDHDDASETAADTANAHTIAKRGVGGPGSPLPHGEVIQKAFGRHDLSNVKAHLGRHAEEASAALGAEAYATGSDIAFTGTPTLHTAAHEAAHIIQQRAGVSLKDGIGESGDRYERHADEVADAVVRGQSAEPILDRMTGAPSATQALQREEAADESDHDQEVGATGEKDDERAALERELIDIIGTHFAGGYEIDMSTMDVSGIPLLTLYSEASATTWPDGVTGIAFDKFLGFGCILSAASQIEDALIRLAGGDAANWRRATLVLVNRVNTELTRFGVAAAWGGLIGGGGVLTFLQHDAATSYQATPDDPGSIALYASELAKLAQDFDELVPDISRAVDIGLEELDGVYELTLPGRTGIWVKDGEDEVFIAAEQRKREDDLAALRRLYDNAVSAETAGNEVDAEHSFAAWVSSVLGGVERPDVNLGVQALNALASANGAVLAMTEAKASGVVPWVESLYVATDAIGGAAGSVYNYSSRIEEWRSGMLAGAEEGLALARSIRDHALSFVATAGVAMATPALAGFLRVSQPVANFLLTGAAEIAKGVIIEGSEKDGDWERIDFIKVGKDALVAQAANALSFPIKQRLPAWANQHGFPTLATQRSVDSLGTAIEGAIMDSIQIYRGQSIPYDVFMQNIARNLVAGAVSSQ